MRRDESTSLQKGQSALGPTLKHLQQGAEKPVPFGFECNFEETICLSDHIVEAGNGVNEGFHLRRVVILALKLIGLTDKPSHETKRETETDIDVSPTQIEKKNQGNGPKSAHRALHIGHFSEVKECG